MWMCDLVLPNLNFLAASKPCVAKLCLELAYDKDHLFFPLFPFPINEQQLTLELEEMLNN